MGEILEFVQLALAIVGLVVVLTSLLAAIVAVRLLRSLCDRESKCCHAESPVWSTSANTEILPASPHAQSLVIKLPEPLLAGQRTFRPHGSGQVPASVPSLPSGVPAGGCSAEGEVEMETFKCEHCGTPVTTSPSRQIVEDAGNFLVYVCAGCGQETAKHVPLELPGWQDAAGNR
jgi:hypothetical protein